MRRLLSPALETEQLPTTVALEGASELDFEVLHQMVAALEAECLRVDEAVEVADTLTELSAVADGDQLGVGGNRVLAVATESLMSRVGFSEPLFVALEDGELAEYHAPSAGAAAPAAAPVDSRHFGQKILDKVKEIWRAIIAAIKRIRVWFNDFMRKLLDLTPWTKRKVEALQKRTSELLKKNLHTEMTHLSATGTHNLYRGLAGYKDAFPNNLPKLADATVSALQAQLKRLSSEEIYTGPFLKRITGDLSSVEYSAAAELQSSGLKRHLIIYVGRREIPAGGRMYCSEDLLGGNVIGQVVGPANCKGAEALKWYSYSPSLTHEESKDPGKYLEHWKKPMPVQRLQDCEQLLKAALDLCNMVLDFRKIQSKLENVADEMEALAGQQLKRMDTNGVEAWKEDDDGKARQHFLSQGPRIFAREPANTILFAQHCASNLAGYVEMNLKLYEGVEKQAAKE